MVSFIIIEGNILSNRWDWLIRESYSEREREKILFEFGE